MNRPDEGDASPVAGRACDGCTLCCTLLGVAEIAKPQQASCAQCAVGVGCRVYDGRPSHCSEFFCSYLLKEELGEEWRPSECHMVVHETGPFRIVIHVDAERRHAWRKEPHYSQIRAWARRVAPHRGQVIVWQGLDVVAVLPDREKMLGRIGDDQLIVTLDEITPHGVKRDVHVLERDDPRLLRADRRPFTTLPSGA